jgi:hypothetical protein
VSISDITQASDAILANHVIAVNQSPHHVGHNHIHEFQLATTLTVDQLKIKMPHDMIAEKTFGSNRFAMI